MTDTYSSADDIAEQIIQRVGKTINLGLPIGIGKATYVVDALFDRASADPSIALSIFTGLTLESPNASGDLEQRLLAPIKQRLYGQWVTPKYAQAIRRGALPANIRVREFYLRPGAFLGNHTVQQSYSSINYSQVAAELKATGVNVIAQLVATRPESPQHLSLGSNPEITLDLLPFFEQQRQKGNPVLLVGQVSGAMPYMLGDAELPADAFDLLLAGPEQPLFPLPNRQVSPADYAAGMHVASLVPDGGTLQVGIGSLSDAVAHCLRLRHEKPMVFAEVLKALPGGSASQRRQQLPIFDQPFTKGLFASTELLSDALFTLFESGLISRAADDDDTSTVHAGFFVGSQRFYERLQALNESERRKINMTRISHVNTLFGDESRKRHQRQHARFINETMMVTLLGAAVSDGLEDGRVVSGVGGQFDFVAMGQALDDAMSILMCRATRLSRGKLSSNVRWTYGHTTVPRHHRDVYVTEYGIAATRGRADADVISEMLHISDGTFQSELVAAARKAGKLPADFEISSEARHNRIDAIRDVFNRDDLKPYFPDYPLGSVLTETEQDLAKALRWLKAATENPLRNAGTLLSTACGRPKGAHRTALAHMKLEKPTGLRQRLLRRIIRNALDRTQS